MDNDNERPNQGTEANSDWRDELQPESRQRIVNNIMDTFERLLPVSGQEKLQMIAQWFEEKIFSVATSQNDYLQKISSEMLAMETRSEGSGPNMDNDDNRRPNQGTEANMETSDWRYGLRPQPRQIIVNNIMDALKRHFPVSGPEGLNELLKIARRFEEKIFTAATSLPDYLRKISSKMLVMETGGSGSN